MPRSPTTPSDDSWLDGLNPAQREAVTHGDGPLLVVAGAGTGKTRTLVCRVGYLIRQGVDPGRILLLTFTRRAAAEMLTRVGKIAGSQSATSVWGGTFHAVANRLLRVYGRALGLPANFTVMDQGDAADLMNLIRSDLGLAKRDRRFPKKATLLGIYSRMVSAQEPLDATLETHFPWCEGDIDDLREIFDQYAQRKQAQHLLDYDDLLLFWSALCTAPGVGRTIADQFDHVLVDEYQDTNSVQAEILRGMRQGHKNIMVVGDDAQSIYSFRAATVRNILDFPDEFPGTRVVTLEQNYRSVQPILAASNAVMEPARERYTKELWSHRESSEKPLLVTCLDEAGQCEAVCRRIVDHLEQGTTLMQQAVLFRAGHHSAQLEVELARRNLPFRKYGGLKFVEAAHIKDMLALLRVLENPFDVISWFRVLLMFDGIGPKSARRIISELGIVADGRRREGSGDQQEPAVSPLTRLVGEPPSVPPAARAQFAEFRSTIADCTEVSDRSPTRSTRSSRKPSGRTAGSLRKPALTTQLERIRRFYEPIFEARYDNATIRLRDLDQLTQIATGYRSRGRFITDLTLDPPLATSDFAGPPLLDEDYLTLSTIHSAKGCEWKVVHIIHAADGMIPSDMAVGDEAGVEEERRLFYVAMTRAADHLYVYAPLRYYHRRFGHSDDHGYAQLTRFITDSVRAFFEDRSGGTDFQETPGAGDDDRKAPEFSSDPYGRVRQLWASSGE